MKTLEQFCEENNWAIVHKHETEARPKRLFGYSDLNLSAPTLKYLKTFAPDGIYLHQREAIRHNQEGNNVCLSTGTASGKSLAFYVAGLETLTKDPTARVLAIYPIKALGVEQEERWGNVFKYAHLNVKVGRIDGQVQVNERKKILQQSRVLISTPDVIHAWLLSNLSDTAIITFLKSVRLIVVDEVHAYTGVFGSNSAFLFRRLRHLMNLCDHTPQFFCSSATIADPHEHLQKLFGIPFSIIDAHYDTSPRYGMDIYMLDPPKSGDLLGEMAKFFLYVAQEKGRFIGFVDSRKQTEQLTSIITRGQLQETEEEVGATAANHLETLKILPYRAGYEEQDRFTIQNRLSGGHLQGVVSTSSLELGLDIPNLEVAVLIGVPYSATSFYQRIGRIGRHKKGTVFILNTGSFYDELVFKNPKKLMERPLIRSTLYLGNQRIQYIHALCLARQGGEHDQVLSKVATATESEIFHTSVNWPDGFVKLCHAERIGSIPPELQSLKAEAGDDPNHVFPLRDVESQFKVELRQGPEQRDLGQLSYSQVMREAFPGAVYYYTTNAYRVYKVSPQSKLIHVRKEKRYNTVPVTPSTFVFPNLTEGNVYISRKHGNLTVFEANLQIRESVMGFIERRGPSEKRFSYPLDATQTNVFYDKSRFTRNYFTSGVVFTHPAFNRAEVHLESIAKLIYEAFLICIPHERQDLDFAVDKHRTRKPGYFEEGNKFIAIFDKTYGSLRLSGHIMEEKLMLSVIEQAIEIVKLDDKIVEVNPQTLEALEELYEESRKRGTRFTFFDHELNEVTDNLEKIILPGSVGMAISTGNQEYQIENVFFNPKQGVLCYRGRYLIQSQDDTSEIILPIASVVEIPGESRIGYYDYERGQIFSTINNS